MIFSFSFNYVLDQTADIDEKAIRMEEPEELVMTLAQAKVVHYHPKSYISSNVGNFPFEFELG